VRLESRAVSGGVLDHHHQPNRALMLAGKGLSLASISPMCVLKIGHKPIDLHRQDLGRAEEADIDGLAMLAGWHLELGLPTRVSDRTQDPSNPELTGIPDRRPRRRIALEDNVQPDRDTDSALSVELDGRVAELDSAHGIGGHTGTSSKWS
jgi:hypothetical protein